MRNYSTYLSEGRFSIFLFHGVIEEQSHLVRNYNRKHLPVLDFQNMLERLLQEGGQPISMQEIVEAYFEKTNLPQKAFAVTFDDGFLNNFQVAIPVLEKLEIPAMFYLTTGFLEDNSCSWIDEIEYVFEYFEKLNFCLPGTNERVTVSSVGEKVDILNRIRQVVKNNSKIDPYAYSGNIWKQMDMTEMKNDRMLDDKLNWEQVREIDKHVLFDIGGHSHTHRVLSFLSEDSLEQEIALSIEILEKELGRKLTHYSYPEGQSNCYSPFVIEKLKRHGIVCSPSAIEGINYPGDDLFHLNRIQVT